MPHGESYRGRAFSTFEYVSKGKSGASHDQSRPGFLCFGSTDFLHQILLCCGALLCMWNSIPKPLPMRCQQPLTLPHSGDSQKCVQTLPNVLGAKGTWGDKCPWAENYQSREYI